MKSVCTSVKDRTLVVVSGFVVLLVVFSCYLVYYSASFYGINETGDEVKENLARTEQRMATIEGCITDSNDDRITYAEKPNQPAACMHLSYGQLIGYNSLTYGKYGLRRTFEKELFTGDKDHRGATLKLTTVNRLQDAAYEEIKDTEGCVVILENATGRILALVTACPGLEFDVNHVEETVKAFDSSGYDGAWIQNWSKKLAPGSTMKPVTATLVYDENRSEEVYNDTGSEKIGGYVFHNAGGAVNGRITLKKAVVKSCNTYFSHMADEMGAFKLQNRAEAFYIGKDLELDFCTIRSEHNLTHSTTEEIAAAGIGQGKLLLTPMNMALIAQTIANGGAVKKPYLIDSIYTPQGFLYQGKTEVLGRACAEETAAYVADAMREAAVSYGIDKNLGIHAKTGTAQVNGTHRASFISFNDSYTVCIVENHTSKAGRNLASKAVRLYKVLESL